MTSKFQRPAGAYAGVSGLANRTKYQDDANAVPKRAISSSKMDGDLNYIIDSLNTLDNASGTRGSIGERLDVALNADGTLKAEVTANYSEWVVQASPGTLTKVDDTSLTLGGGDFRAIYLPNRRVKVVASGVAVYGDVVSAGYSGGQTTVVLAGIVNESGGASVVPTTPTQIAYAPLTPGASGSLPRRMDSVSVVASGAVYEVTGAGADMVVKRNGSEVLRVDAGGLANGCVGSAGLNSGVQLKLVPSGVVVPFAGNSAPSGWLLCAGQAVSRATYAELFSAIGTTYGAGDGSTTFGLPDLRGRSVFGLDNMGGTVAGRVTSGISGISGTALGAAGGSEAMHSHSHTATVTDAGHSHDANAVYGAASNNPSGMALTRDTGTTGSRLVTKTATTGITVSNASTGSGTSQNMVPAMMLNMIIKV
jgi:microcystin-dependent protein